MNDFKKPDGEYPIWMNLIMATDLGGDPFDHDWVQQVKHPFMIENPNGSVTFCRLAADADEEKLYLRIMAKNFLELFQGNPNVHYTYDPSRPKPYLKVDRGIELQDVVRHLNGIQPSLLSIPILPADAKGYFLTHFGVLDADRHSEADEPIEHSKLAQLVAVLHLPLIVCESKSPKSAHLPIFWKDQNGFSCTLTRQLLQEWAKELDIKGEMDLFPRQTELKADEQTHEMQIGSGVNLPYFGATRHAFGEYGQRLSLEEFLVLAAQHRTFGLVVAKRELSGKQPEPFETGTKNRKYGPMTVDTIRDIHSKNLQDLVASNQTGHWNDTANDTAFFAGMAFAAKALDGTESSIKNEIIKSANPAKGEESRLNSTLKSGWESGIKQPLTVVEIADVAIISKPDMPESVLDGKLGKWCRERLGDFPVAYSWPSMLASAAQLVKPHPKHRVNVNICLVGPLHSGKSQAQDRAHFLFSLKDAGMLEELKSGSGEGLLEKIGDRQGKAVLWWPDELSHLLEKAQIEHSSFPSILNTVFYSDITMLTVTRRKQVNFNARLSIEGGVVETNFGDSFGAATTTGLYDRFLFSVCPSDFLYSYRPMNGEPLFKLKNGLDGDLFTGPSDPMGHGLNIVTPEIDSSVWAARDDIQKAEGIEPRILEICIRVALICAAWDGKPVLRAPDLGPHLELARYQMKVRALLQPNAGRNFEGIVAIKILNFLKANCDGQKWIAYREVYRATHVMEYGPSTAKNAIGSMAFSGAIETAEVKTKGGGRSRLMLRLPVEG